MRFAERVLTMTSDLKNLVVICVDGGICSQLSFVAFGFYLKSVLGDAVRVKYDLSWYDRFGCDNCGRQARTWSVPKAFPNLGLEIATEAEVRILSRRFAIRDLQSVREMPVPAYLNGYPLEMRGSANTFRSLVREFIPKDGFRPVLNEWSARTLALIESGPICGIHVRRGDLADGSPGFGRPTSVSYFLTSIRLVHGINPEAKFLFFSDEPDWVADEIVPCLPDWCRFEVLRGNGSDCGYLDLYLLSRCDYVVSSIGSFGHFAAMLSDKVKWLVMSRRREQVLNTLEHCIYVNDDRETELDRARRAAEEKTHRDSCLGACLGNWLGLRFKRWRAGQ